MMVTRTGPREAGARRLLVAGLLLGAAQGLAVLFSGLTQSRGHSTVPMLLPLLPLFALIAFTSTPQMRTLPRRAAVWALSATQAGLVSIATVVGAVAFPAAWPWWISAAVVTSLPAMIVGWLSCVDAGRGAADRRGGQGWR
jgi:hypothetical protein